MDRILAACGNDCSACPRYTAHPYEKSEEELRRTAELWLKIGYRDHIVSNEEISCTGCKPENWCRYRVAGCCEEKGIKACSCIAWQDAVREKGSKRVHPVRSIPVKTSGNALK